MDTWPTLHLFSSFGDHLGARFGFHTPGWPARCPPQSPQLWAQGQVQIVPQFRAPWFFPFLRQDQRSNSRPVYCLQPPGPVELGQTQGGVEIGDGDAAPSSA